MEEKIKFPPAKRTGRKVLVPCRLSYAHLDKPHVSQKSTDATPKYEVTCVIPKTDKETLAVVKAAYDEAVAFGKERINAKWKPSPKSEFLKDGDELEDPRNFAGCMFFAARSSRPVPVLNRLKDEIKPEEAYSGCYAYVSADLFPYSKGQDGISAGLNAVLKLGDGERLGGGGDPRNDFEGIDFGVDDSLEEL